MRKERGFTLIELLVTIAIVAILAGVGVPSLTWMVDTNRRAAATNRLISDIQVARSTAASLGQETVLCHSFNGSNCSNEGSPDWADGWLLFLDTSPKNGELDSGEQVLGRNDGEPQLEMPSTIGRFRFKPGIKFMNGGTIAICPKHALPKWVIVAPATGRVRSQDNEPFGLSCPTP